MEGTPVTPGIYKLPFKFTGKITKVTIDLQEVKAATANEVEKSHKEAALKKGLSD